ncbi:hypothetical protein GYMLUDRAFT_49389 [Collybiopsis luxurians FD-317 M1]|uniref:C2H2-type domain-containing protein n=1 Tax=Collybiopsis luxurians FD-317 M1 TaxID=944289 RepID=A0A0D0BUY9_9AGAR|nr:hypothetical protein GYMLUDRAFT_49389 [Collybiopsis luxurians FD-317 M1]
MPTTNGPHLFTNEGFDQQGISNQAPIGLGFQVPSTSTMDLNGPSNPNVHSLATSPDDSLSTTAVSLSPTARCLIQQDGRICKMLLSGETYIAHFERDHSMNGPRKCRWAGCHRRRALCTQQRLLTHLETHLNSIRQKFFCDHPRCRRSFSRKDGLSRHLKKFHRPRKY